MNDKDIYFNGINGATGEYTTEPMNFDELAQLIKGEPVDKDHIDRMEQSSSNLRRDSFGMPFGTDPSDVKQAGWAVVFHAEESTAVKDALAPLIEHRRTQIGEAKTKELQYRPGETWLQWLDRYGATPGDVNPTSVPYYVLIVGAPSRMPYEFNYLMDVDYAVGRLSFDTPDEYRRYVESVIEYETSTNVPNGKTAVLFGTKHPLDRATQLSCEQLVQPLAGEAEGTSIIEQVDFAKCCFIAQEATKANLNEVFCPSPGTKPPAMLFTATHGIEFKKGEPNQLGTQGALLCQDWRRGGMSNKYYYAAADLPDDAQVHGMITFHFACYGGGTPLRDNFPRQAGQEPPEIADKPFVAMLPKRLLAHPRGGALAVVGHIERAWGCSITGMSSRAGRSQVLPFKNTIGYVLTGKPVGYAVKDFNERTASLSTYLSELLEDVRYHEEVSDRELASTWLGRNDARNYIIVGDPAVHLRVEAMT